MNSYSFLENGQKGAFLGVYKGGTPYRVQKTKKWAKKGQKKSYSLHFWPFLAFFRVFSSILSDPPLNQA